MSIVTTMTINDMVNELMDDEWASWSYEGATALAEWLEEVYDGSGEPWEWDRVALRCEFEEYPDIETVLESYNLDEDEDLSDHTTVIEFKNGIIIQQF